METSILDGVLILLGCVLVAATLFKRLHLPPVLGYLLVGMVVGPYGLGLIMAEIKSTQELAEYGVVFLMFTIGLEFSLPRLVAMKRVVLGLGGLQVLFTTLLIMGLALLAGGRFIGAFVTGGILAMSSTAITMKQLHDQLELNTVYGHNALGVLLFQDIAVIPFLILIPSLSGNSEGIFVPLVWATVKAAGVMLAIFLAGRWVLRPLFREIASTKSLEMFTLAILLVTLGAAWLTERLELSLTLGAFLAGMMLGETEFRHQIEIEIRPFRDLLLGLFFITIGMLINLRGIGSIWPSVLILLSAIVIFKTVLIFCLSRLLGDDSSNAFRTGLVLAQGGEFGFALLAVSQSHSLIRAENEQIILAALVFSLALAPFIIRFNKQICSFFLPKATAMREDVVLSSIEANAKGLKDHVIICGYGRVGQNIARFLENEGYEFIALDMDPEMIESAQLARERVTYGDSTNLNMLKAAGIADAKALAISFHDSPSAFKILHQVHKAYKDLPVLVRTEDDSQLKEFLAAGATEVIPETLEASLMMAFHMLLLLGVPAGRAMRQIKEVRNNRYELLHRAFPSHEWDDLEEAGTDKKQLTVIPIDENAACVDKSIEELHLSRLNVSITALCRGNIRRPDPPPDTVIRPRDVLVIYGAQNDLEQVERELLA